MLINIYYLGGIPAFQHAAFEGTMCIYYTVIGRFIEKGAGPVTRRLAFDLDDIPIDGEMGSLNVIKGDLPASNGKKIPDRYLPAVY